MEAVRGAQGPAQGKGRGLISLVFTALLAFGTRACAGEPSAVMIVGDSHTTQIFGQTLDAELRAGKGQVATFAVCSSRPDSFLDELEHGCGYLFKDFDGNTPAKWVRTRRGKTLIWGKEQEATLIKTPKLATLLADYKPSRVLVALGSNGVWGTMVRDMVARIHEAGAACFWIGPPRMRNVAPKDLDGIYALMAAQGVKPDASPTGEGCRLILDSRALDYLVYPEKEGDGTHYAWTPALSALGTRWGHDAASAFEKTLSPENFPLK